MLVRSSVGRSVGRMDGWRNDTHAHVCVCVCSNLHREREIYAMREGEG